MYLPGLSLLLAGIMSYTVPDKITFDISKISSTGLIGSPGSYRALDYEFCIPREEKYLQEVKEIDPNLRVYPNSKGRIGCEKSQYLCIGNTRQQGWREILMKLADLPYIEKIQQTYWE